MGVGCAARCRFRVCVPAFQEQERTGDKSFAATRRDKEDWPMPNAASLASASRHVCAFGCCLAPHPRTARPLLTAGCGQTHFHRWNYPRSGGPAGHCPL